MKTKKEVKEFVPYGPDWRQEMMKFSNDELIDQIRNELIKNMQNPELTESLSKSLHSVQFAIKGLRDSHINTHNQLEQHVILESISKLIDIEQNIKLILDGDDDE